MRQGRLLLLGLDGSGKSTLADRVEGEVTDRRHREDCYYRRYTLEIPGAYVENHWMHSIIIMLAQNQASSMALLLDGITQTSYYSSGYVRAFTIPSLGVLTKAGGLTPEQRGDGLRKLEEAGCSEVIALDTVTGEGLEAFDEWSYAHTALSGCA